MLRVNAFWLKCFSLLAYFASTTCILYGNCVFVKSLLLFVMPTLVCNIIKILALSASILSKLKNQKKNN